MHSNSIRRSAIVALAALLAPLSLPAEPVTVSTVPFGGMILEIPAGTSIVSDVFIGSALYQGPVASISGDGNNVLGLSNLPAIEHPAYIHVLSGTDEGMVSTILDADNDSVTVETALNVEVGDIVAIRKHQTVGEFFAGAALNDGDTVTIYNVDGSIETLIFFSDKWRDPATFSIIGDTILFPGEAIVPTLTSPVTLIISGSVNTSPVKVEYGSSVPNIVGSINPVGISLLNSVFADSLSDWDTITLYSNIDGMFSVTGTYLLNPNSNLFVEAATFQPADDVGIKAADGAVIISGGSGFLSIPPAYSN